MELKEFAAMLNGREYGYPQFTQEELRIAKDNGFVIVSGTGIRDGCGGAGRNTVYRRRPHL